MFNTRFRGKNCANAGQEHYLGKVRIRLFVPYCKLDFGSHLWDATVPGVARQSVLVDVNKTGKHPRNNKTSPVGNWSVHICPRFCMFQVSSTSLAGKFMHFRRSAVPHMASTNREKWVGNCSVAA